MKRNYEDMIYLSYPIPKQRKSISQHERAAQFTGFAALQGYEDEILEIERHVEEKIVLSEDACDRLNRQLQYLADHLQEKPRVALTHFVQDAYKKGGTYCKKVTTIKAVDTYQHCLQLSSRESIAFSDLLCVEVLKPVNDIKAL